MINLIGAAASLFAMGFAAIYLQRIVNLEPCPLCMMQRVPMTALVIAFFIAFLHNPGPLGIRLYGLLQLALAGVGIAIAGRHVWLQHLPDDKVPACGPGLEYMMEEFPIFDAVSMVLQGSGECHEIAWSLLGLSIPEQTLLGFIALALVALVQIVMPNRKPPNKHQEASQYAAG